MKLSLKFFCIAYIVVLLSTGIGSAVVIQNSINRMWNAQFERVQASENYAINSLRSLINVSTGIVTGKQKSSMIYQVKNTLDSCITDLDILLESEIEDEAYRLLDINDGWNVFFEDENRLMMESVCKVNISNASYYVRVSSDFTELQNYRVQTWKIYSVVVLCVAAISGLLLYFFSNRITKPLHKLTMVSDNIASGNYGETVDIKTSDREIYELAESFNSMSMATENALNERKKESERRERFVADFTHEMKTPMTSIIGYADMLMSYELSVEERSDCYEEMGMTQLALDDINKAMELTDQRNYAYYYGRRSGIYRYAGMYKEAIEDLDKYIERYPTDAYGYYARGWCQELSGDSKGAMEDYNEGIAVDENYPYIYLMRGTLHMENGDAEKAAADFETVVAKDTTVMGGSCRHYALNFLGKAEEAEEWMNKIIEKDPDEPGEWYDKACLYARMGRCDDAVAALRVSFEKGYRSFPHIEHDNDMDPIRERDDFKSLVAQYKEILETEIAKVAKNVDDEEDMVVSEIDMKKMYGGTYEIPCSVNGLPLKMIFDTGASDVPISSVEASSWSRTDPCLTVT